MIFQGRNLDTGANIRVLFDDVPCHVEGLVVTGIFHINIIITYILMMTIIIIAIIID